MIKFLAIDSSLVNTGYAYGYIDENMYVKVEDIRLITTEKDKSKKVRASSDTISRCSKTYYSTLGIIEDWKPAVIFVETPSGSQNSSAMKSYGATCMLIASLTPAPIQVTPDEVKLASVGNKTASKKEMIEWAYSLYPDISWDKNKDGSLKNKNEHMADAIAIAVAGSKNEDFKKLFSLLKNIKL